MSDHAQRCDSCERMLYNVERVALLVEGQLRVERELCAPCRGRAIDLFVALRDLPHRTSVWATA
jgi:hypothetical protein